MTDIQWNMGWTLATLGLCWVVLSCGFALALGQIIRRSKSETSDGEWSATPPQERDHAQQSPAPRLAADEVTPYLDEEALMEGSRQASGTRLKAIRLESDESARARKVS